jgi:hypothetical protein
MSPEAPKPSAAKSSTAPNVCGPAKSSEVPPKPDPRFRADMPQIPGVNASAARQAGNRQQTMRIAQILGAVVILGGGSAWWLLHGSRASGAPVALEQTLTPTPSPAPAELPPLPPAPIALGRNEIGTVGEFDHPWSAKKFNYTSLLNRDVVPAVAIRLPSGDGQHAASYWGVLLKAPFGQCDLEFLSDLSQISARFGYRANHPMIVDSCSGIVYDPLRTGTLPDGTWSRGDIVKGQGIRPPMQVEIRIEGGHLFAGRAE